MVSDEQKAENRRVHRSRHAARAYVRATEAEIGQMKCYVCGERPHIRLTDYREGDARKCVQLGCDCKGKVKWFEIVA